MAAIIKMTAFLDIALCNLVEVEGRFISVIMVVHTSETSVYCECEISSSHGGEFEVQICVLGCSAV
jgi:hypothetical protein